MTPLSSDPEKQAKQLANLKQGGTVAPSGNRRAESHGAYASIAKAELEDRMAQIYLAIVEDAPIREADGSLPAADVLAVKALAEVEVRLDRIAGFLERRGWEDDDGKERPVLLYEARLQDHKLSLLKELGMTPAARAKLGVDLVRVANATEDAEAARAARERLDQRLDALDADGEDAE